LYNALQLGAVTEADIDRAAGRIYHTQIKLGMLDEPEDQEYQRWGPEMVDTVESRALSRRAAQEGLVLLKNEPPVLATGTAIHTSGPVLPLTKGLKLAFIGPHANSTQSLLSNYHGKNELVNSHSPLLAAQAAGLNVSYAMGCNICDFPVRTSLLHSLPATRSNPELSDNVALTVSRLSDRKKSRVSEHALSRWEGG
jgi:beta-glucosidase-like glycosyl hydrolase